LVKTGGRRITGKDTIRCAYREKVGLARTTAQAGIRRQKAEGRRQKGRTLISSRTKENVTVSCHAFKLGISSEQDAKPAAWLRLTHYKDCALIDINV
jgi:hypothetical protein